MSGSRSRVLFKVKMKNANTQMQGSLYSEFRWTLGVFRPFRWLASIDLYQCLGK